MLTRRRTLAGALAAFAPALPLSAAVARAAEPFPNKPVRMILPGPAGGLIDIAARAIADAMVADLGQPLTVDPRPGGNGVVAGSMVVNAPPDGHTLLLTVSGHLILPYLMKVPFDVMTDFTPVAMVGVSTAMICVPPSLPPDTLADLVAYARAHRGKVNYLNPGNGTGAHLIPEMLRIRHGIDITSISYKGLPPGVQDLLAGRIELGVISTSLALQHVKTGRLKAIAIVGSQRIADLPDVATMAEQGFGDMEVRSSLPLYGPPGLPAAIVERLNRSVAKALADPEARRRLASVHIEPTPMSTLVLAAELRAEHDRLRKLISGLGIKADGGG